MLHNHIKEEAFNYIRKYYKPIVKDVIRKDKYPLDCFLFREIYQMDKRINDRGDSLKKIKEKFGEEFLYKLRNELKGEKGIEFSEKLYSLQTELDCALLLSKITGDISIKKIKKFADLLLKYNNDKWYIQVKKSFDEIDIFLIVETLRGSLFLKKNKILRNYNKVHIEWEHIDKLFRNKIIDFIHNDLINIILEVTTNCKQKGFKDFTLKMTKDIIENEKRKGIMDISVDGDDKNIRISFCFNLARKKIKGIFKLEMQKDERFKYYSIPYLRTYWLDVKNLNKEGLNKKIKILKSKCEEIMKQLNNINRKLKKAGFIQLDINYEFEGSFKAWERELKSILDNKFPDMPCIIFPCFTIFPIVFERATPILNQAAENSIFSQLVTNSN